MYYYIYIKYLNILKLLINLMNKLYITCVLIYDRFYTFSVKLNNSLNNFFIKLLLLFYI